jgi:hypothetical protein
VAEIDNMMGGSGHFATRSGNIQAFFGPSSGFSFIYRTLELFLPESNDSSATEVEAALLDLFDGPLIDKVGLKLQQCFNQGLPPRQTCLHLLDLLFAKCSLIAQFLVQADLRQMIDRLYDAVPLKHDERTSGLIHSVVALGYLYDTPLHQGQGCRAVVIEA